MWEKRKLVEAGDPRLMGKYDVQEMERMLMVGLICVHPDHENMPRVRDAARILKGEALLPLLPSCKPRVGVAMVVVESAVTSFYICYAEDPLLIRRWDTEFFNQIYISGFNTRV
ncbi:hypothetical protein K1719_004783 [Acacia pycnantha]|nr:hypothetical protein K1719_004783 [Acacia pycnantha]